MFVVVLFCWFKWGRGWVFVVREGFVFECEIRFLSVVEKDVIFDLKWEIW